MAMTWTLLIFILCCIPGYELPDVKVPLADKWAHLVLFAVFTFLWHLTNPIRNARFVLVLLLIAAFTGWLVEYIQGHYIPGRTQDNMDMLMDITGAILGSLMFTILSLSFHKK